MEAYRCYASYDPEHSDQKASMALAFINQSDVKKKLQKQERLGEKSLRDLVLSWQRGFTITEIAQRKSWLRHRRGRIRTWLKYFWLGQLSPEKESGSSNNLLVEKTQREDVERR